MPNSTGPLTFNISVDGVSGTMTTNSDKPQTPGRLAYVPYFPSSAKKEEGCLTCTIGDDIVITLSMAGNKGSVMIGDHDDFDGFDITEQEAIKIRYLTSKVEISESNDLPQTRQALYDAVIELARSYAPEGDAGSRCALYVRQTDMAVSGTE
jgi:hypothetical protein